MIEGTDDSVRAYVLVCAKNAARRVLAKELRQRDLTNSLIELPLDAPSAYEEFEQSEDYDRLVKAIRRLSPIYRDVLLMHYVYELRLDEIAARLERKKGTVKQQLERGKKQLLELYRKEGASDEKAVNL